MQGGTTASARDIRCVDLLQAPVRCRMDNPVGEEEEMTFDCSLQSCVKRPCKSWNMLTKACAARELETEVPQQRKLPDSFSTALRLPLRPHTLALLLHSTTRRPVRHCGSVPALTLSHAGLNLART